MNAIAAIFHNFIHDLTFDEQNYEKEQQAKYQANQDQLLKACLMAVKLSSNNKSTGIIITIDANHNYIIS